MSFQYGLGAPLSGPCLVTSCGGKASLGTFCGSTVQLCTAGSTGFNNPVDAKDVGEKCSYTYSDTASGATGSCSMQPLSGQLGGSGKSWSLSDSSTTVALTPTVVVENNGAQITILYVASTTSLSHFVSGGAALATSSSSSTSSSTTSSVSTTASTTSSCTSYGTAVSGSPSSSMTDVPLYGNATTTFASGTGSPATVTTINSVGASASTSSTSSTATISKSGVNKLSGPKVWTSIAIGALVIAACVA